MGILEMTRMYKLFAPAGARQSENSQQRARDEPGSTAGGNKWEIWKGDRFQY